MMQSKGHGEKFSRKQELAVLALITEPSFEAAAKKEDDNKRICPSRVPR